MKLERACTKAQAQSKRLNADVYVVRDNDDGYDTTNNVGLDTYYLGAFVEQHYLCGELQLSD